jgi:hypothetical protein
MFKKAIRQFRKIPFFINSFIKYPGESLQYQQLVFMRKLGLDKKVMSDNYSLYEEQIRDKYDELLAHYVLEPIDTQITLFRAEKRLYFIDDRKFLGWDKVSLKGVRIFSIPGDHRSFLEPPNDKKFAEVVQQAIPD